MGACSSKNKQLKAELRESRLVAIVLEEVRSKILPEVLHALQMAEIEVHAIAEQAKYNVLH